MLDFANDLPNLRANPPFGLSVKMHTSVIWEKTILL